MGPNEMRDDAKRCHDTCIFLGAQPDLREKELRKHNHSHPTLASMAAAVQVVECWKKGLLAEQQACCSYSALHYHQGSPDTVERESPWHCEICVK